MTLYNVVKNEIDNFTDNKFENSDLLASSIVKEIKKKYKFIGSGELCFNVEITANKEEVNCYIKDSFNNKFYLPNALAWYIGKKLMIIEIKD